MIKLIEPWFSINSSEKEKLMAEYYIVQYTL